MKYLEKYIIRNIQSGELKIKEVKFFDLIESDIFEYTLHDYLLEEYSDELYNGHIIPSKCLIVLGKNESFYIVGSSNKNDENSIYVFGCNTIYFNVLEFKECFKTSLDGEFGMKIDELRQKNC